MFECNSPTPTVFLSTLSLRRATEQSAPPNDRISISIHALLAESDRRGAVICYLDNIISIHALLAESDRYSLRHSTPSGHFYPRSPCGERPARPTANNATTKFLSTLSLRRATQSLNLPSKPMENFYPRSPCGERHYFSAVMRQNPGISIHALLAESDLFAVLFLRGSYISIHALLAESDDYQHFSYH